MYNISVWRTRPKELLEPDVVQYCGARGVPIMDDVQLIGVLGDDPK